MRRALLPLAALALTAATVAATGTAPAAELAAALSAPPAAASPPGQASGRPDGQPAVPAAAAALAAAAPSPVCPGPETLLPPQGGRAVAPAGPWAVAAAAAGPRGSAARMSPVTPSPDRPSPGTATLTVGADGVTVLGRDLTTAGPVRLEVRRGPRRPAVPPSLSLVQAGLARTGDARGLVATACPALTADAWFVGGGTVEGRRGRLLLANPTSAVTTVDVVVHAADGPVDVPSALGIALRPGGTRTLQLDALAPGHPAVAVHVTARSGRFVATLHDTLLRGLVPGGADDVGPAQPPARRQVVPGVTITVPAGARLPRSAQAPGAFAVRLAVPGDRDAVVRLRLLGPDGPLDLNGAEVVTVPARGVLDVPLRGIAAGTWSVVADADVPVVAGALVGRTARGGEVAGTPAAVGADVPPAEFAWAGSAAFLTPGSVTAVPTPALGGVVSAALVLAAPGAATSPAGELVRVVQVTAGGVPGPVRKVRVPAGSTVRVPLAAGTAAVRVDPARTGTLAGALELASSDDAGAFLSVVPVPARPSTSAAAPRAEEDRRTGL